MTVAGIGESFAGVLEELAFDNGIGRTGCLYVMADDERHAGRIYLYEGQVYAIHVDGFRPRFIQRMHVGGYITDAQRDDLIARCGGPYSENAGTVAMETGMVDRTLVEVMYREMLLSAAGAMASWGAIRTIFEHGEQTQAFAVKPLSVRALNTAVAKRREKWNELWQTVCPTSPIEGAFPRSLITPAEAHAREFPSEVAALTAVCDGQTRFDDVAGALGLTRFETVVFLGLLLDSHVITFDTVPGTTSTLPPLNETLEFSDALPDGSQAGSYAHESFAGAGPVPDTAADAAAAASIPATVAETDEESEDSKAKKERRFFRRNKKQKKGEDDDSLVLGDDDEAPTAPLVAPQPHPVAQEVIRTAPELNPSLVAPNEAAHHPVHQVPPMPSVLAPAVPAVESFPAPEAEVAPAQQVAVEPAASMAPPMPSVFAAPVDPLTAPAEVVLPPARSDVPPVGGTFSAPPMPFRAEPDPKAVMPAVAAPLNPFATAAPAPVEEIAVESPDSAEDTVADAVHAEALSGEALLPAPSLPPLPPMPTAFMPSVAEPVQESLVVDEPVAEAGLVDAAAEAAVEVEPFADDSTDQEVVLESAFPVPSAPVMPSGFMPAPYAPGQDTSGDLSEAVQGEEVVLSVDEPGAALNLAEFLDAEFSVPAVEGTDQVVPADGLALVTDEEPVNLDSDLLPEADEDTHDVADLVAEAAEMPETAETVQREGGSEVEDIFEATSEGWGAEMPREADEVPAEETVAQVTEIGFVSEVVEQTDEIQVSEQVEEINLLAHARAAVEEAIAAKSTAAEMREHAKQRLADLENTVTEAVSLESNAYDEKAACVEASHSAKAALRAARDEAHAAEADRVAAAEALREAQERYAQAEAVSQGAVERVGEAEKSVVEHADALHEAFNRLNVAATFTAQTKSDLAMAATEADIAEQSVKHCKDVLAAAKDALEALEEV